MVDDTTSSVSRRTALQTIAAGTTIGVAGCLGVGGGGGGSDPIQFITPGGSTQEAQEQLFDQWTEESGVEVEMTPIGGNVERITQVKQNPDTYDIVDLDDEGSARSIDEGIIEPIDFSKLPNYEENVQEAALGLPFLNDGDETYGLLLNHLATAFAYNTELVDEELTSWGDIKDSKYEGAVSLTTRFADRFANAAASAGVDVNKAPDDEDVFDTIVSELNAQDENVFSYWSDGETSMQYLRQENAHICEAWAGRVLSIQENGYDHIEFVMPEEGAVATCDALGIVDGTNKREDVYDLLNFVYERENLVEFSEMVGYTTPVTDPPESMTNLLDYSSVEERVWRDWSKILPVVDEWSQTFEEIVQN